MSRNEQIILLQKFPLAFDFTIGVRDSDFSFRNPNNLIHRSSFIYTTGGMVNVLQQAALPIVSNDVCDKKNRPITQVPILDNMVCGGSGGSDQVSGCHGDSGGPLVCEVDGKWEVHGSVSHGPPTCSSEDAYTVFSRTSYFTQWIKHVIATAD